MQIPLINEHLFSKYFVRLSIRNATKGFATYGCFHPCLICNKYVPFYGYIIQARKEHEHTKHNGTGSFNTNLWEMLSII